MSGVYNIFYFYFSFWLKKVTQFLIAIWITICTLSILCGRCYGKVKIWQAEGTSRCYMLHKVRIFLMIGLGQRIFLLHAWHFAVMSMVEFSPHTFLCSTLHCWQTIDSTSYICSTFYYLEFNPLKITLFFHLKS